MTIANTWGAMPEERARPMPCDGLLAGARAYHRGVTVQAPPSIVYRWLCQLRVAPYSYEWIDNFGRRSPQALTPGLGDLAVGQMAMSSFEIVAFERDRHLTARSRGRLSRGFGAIAVTYEVRPEGAASRLLVRCLVRYPRGPLGWLLRQLLPWGDLVMMRRQLLNLKRLAERDALAAG